MKNNILIGAAVGVVLALILAPFKGKDLCKMLHKKEQNPFIITKIQRYVRKKK